MDFFLNRHIYNMNWKYVKDSFISRWTWFFHLNHWLNLLQRASTKGPQIYPNCKITTFEITIRTLLSGESI